MVKGSYTPPHSHTDSTVEAVTGSDSDGNSGLTVGEGRAGLRTDGTTQLQATNDGVTMLEPFVAITATDSPFTVQTDDKIILVDSTNGAVDISLPAASTAAQRRYIIKDIGGAPAANNITLTAQSGSVETFASVSIVNPYTAFSVYSDGNNYWRIS